MQTSDYHRPIEHVGEFVEPDEEMPSYRELESRGQLRLPLRAPEGVGG